MLSNLTNDLMINTAWLAKNQDQFSWHKNKNEDI